MYIVYLAKIAKIPIFQHLIMCPEVAGTIIFHRKGVLWVYFKLSETILHYKSAFHGDFHIFEKYRFFAFKIWPIKGKSQILQRIRVWIKWLFCSKILPDSPHPHLESTFPPLLPTCILGVDIFKNRSKNFNFWSFFNIKVNFHFYFLKLFSSKSMYSELSNALSNVILS